MNIKNGTSIMLAVLLVITMFFGIVIPAKSQSAMADVGGFLYPWQADAGEMQIGSKGIHDGKALDFLMVGSHSEFPVLAPKEGVVVDFFDDYPETPQDTCGGNSRALFVNYIVLGHGLKSNGTYNYYTLIYHFKQNSIDSANIQIGQWVKMGQRIGIAGNTGDSDANHVHMEVSRVEPGLNTTRSYYCNGAEIPVAKHRNNIDSNTVSFGFEEQANQWPVVGINGNTANDSLGPSYNHEGLGTVELTGTTNLRQCGEPGQTDDVRLFIHIDFGGECIAVENPGETANLPSWMHLSSVWLRPGWVWYDSGVPQHRLTLFSESDNSGDQLPLDGSSPRLGSWNDRTKSTHNQYFGLNWLREFSIADKLPLESDIHIVVENPNGDFDALRVCFNGGNCQETAATELYYTWPIYLEQTGFYIISVQYRTLSDNQNWANADKVEFGYYLNNDDRYSPCDGGDGATLTSGSDCVRVTDDIRDLAPAGWADRSDLYVSVSGSYEAWVYDGVDYQGAPKVVKSGQNLYVGGNVSSIDLRPPSPVAPPNPIYPFLVDANTVHLYHFDEGNGITLYDSVGALNGVVAGGNSWVTGRFDGAISFPNPTDGRGVTFSPVDICPMTFETWVRAPSPAGRIAGQLGAGGNSGANKWLLYFDGKKPKLEIWSAGGSQSVTSYKEIADSNWHYIMFTYDCGTQANLYLDNELVEDLTTAAQWNGGTTTLEFGASEGIGKCNCEIDEIRISNTIRVPTDPGTLPTPTNTLVPTPDLTVGTGQNIYVNNSSALASSATSGQPKLSLVNAFGFDVGDEVLIIQMKDPSAGNYEFGYIISTNGSTLTLQNNLQHSFAVGGNSRAQVVRVPHYRNVTVQSGGYLRSPDWDGNSGGILALRASGTINIAGAVIMNGGNGQNKTSDHQGGGLGGGFRGGSNSTDGSGAEAGEGISITYPFPIERMENQGNGGGGAGGSSCGICSGAGGGNGGVGGKGNNSNVLGGIAVGNSSLSQIFLGGGGGGGRDDRGQGAGGGGSGGGIVIFFADQISVTGTISANGGNGALGGANEAGGGGGAGGSILLRANSVNIGTNLVTAYNGIGPGNAGEGGTGRIRVEYGTLFSGATNPGASVYQDPSMQSTATPTSTFIPTLTATFTPTFTATYTRTPTNTPTPTLTVTAISGPRIISVPENYSTISQAMEVAQSGDTILVSEGTYNEKFSIKSGVKVIGAGAEKTIIRGDGVGVVVYISGSAELSGFTVTNSGTDNWDAGIWIDNASGKISKNFVTGNSKGIVLYCFSPCTTEPRIANNIIYANTSDGLYVHDGLVSIVNNTITKNYEGIYIDRTGSTILNNIVTGNNVLGIAGNNVSLALDYNNFWNNGQNYNGATPGANDISIDPLYVSPSTNDYHISSSSSLIDRGTSVPGIVDDIDNQTRPFDGNGDGNSILDIGADEYVGPVAPTMTSTSTQTQTPTSTTTFTPTPTLTSTLTATNTATPTATFISTASSTPTFTATYTYTPTNTPTSNPSNLATNKPVSVSSYQDTSHTGSMAVDNNLATYWQSKKAVGKNVLPSEWIDVDLGGYATVTGVELEWNAYYATDYLIRISDDGTNWVTAFSTNAGNGGDDIIQLNSVSGRYVRMESTGWSNSSMRVGLKELQILGYYSSSQPTQTSTATSQPEPIMTETPTPTTGSITSVHVGDLDGSAQQTGKNWRADVVITIHDDNHNPVAGASVEGAWSNGYVGTGMCTTDVTGSCTITSGKAANGSSAITFVVTNVNFSSSVYAMSENHDPDGDGDGSTIIIARP